MAAAAGADHARAEPRRRRVVGIAVHIKHSAVVTNPAGYVEPAHTVLVRASWAGRHGTLPPRIKPIRLGKRSPKLFVERFGKGQHYLGEIE
jgi:hypothetical protein